MFPSGPSSFANEFKHLMQNYPDNLPLRISFTGKVPRRCCFLVDQKAATFHLSLSYRGKIVTRNEILRQLWASFLSWVLNWGRGRILFGTESIINNQGRIQSVVGPIVRDYLWELLEAGPHHITINKVESMRKSSETILLPTAFPQEKFIYNLLHAILLLRSTFSLLSTW